MINANFLTYTYDGGSPTAQNQGGQYVLLQYDQYLQTYDSGTSSAVSLNPTKFKIWLNNTNSVSGSTGFTPDTAEFWGPAGTAANPYSTPFIRLTFTSKSFASFVGYWNSSAGIAQPYLVQLQVDKANINGKNGAISDPNPLTVSGGNTPYNPNSLPLTWVLQTDPTLTTYLERLQKRYPDPQYTGDPSTAVNLSFVAGTGVSMWPSLSLPTKPGDGLPTILNTGQIGGNSTTLLPAANYNLSSLTSGIPSGGSAIVATSSNAQSGLVQWSFDPGESQAYGYQGSALTKPWFTTNLFNSGAFFLSVPTFESAQAGQTKGIPWDQTGGLPWDQTSTSTDVSINSSQALVSFESTNALPPPAGQFQATGQGSVYNYDTTYINQYQLPIDMQAYDLQGNPIPTISLIGGAGYGQLIYDTLQSRVGTQNPSQQRSKLTTSRLLGPASLPPTATITAYQDFSDYFAFLASQATYNGQDPTSNFGLYAAQILRNGDGGNHFNQLAYFVSKPNAKYILLQGTTPGSTSKLTGTSYVLIPWDATTLQTLGLDSYAAKFKVYLGTKGSQNGFYGGNPDYLLFTDNTNWQASTQLDPTQLSGVSGWTFVRGGTNNAQTTAVGDVMFGFNYGMLGSTIEFHNTEIGAMPSNQWFGADGLSSSSPAANGLWGPWAWNAAQYTTQLTKRNFWNTYAFAINGNNFSMPSDDPSTWTPILSPTGYLNKSHSKYQPLIPDVYAWAYGDRLTGGSTKLYNFAPIGQFSDQPSGFQQPYANPANPSIPSTGYVQVTVGAPGLPEPLASVELSVRAIGFEALSTPVTGILQSSATNISYSAFFSPYEPEVDPSRQVGIYNPNTTGQQQTLISRPQARDADSMDSNYGAVLSRMSADAMYDVVKHTEGKSIGSGNLALVKLDSFAETSFGTFEKSPDGKTTYSQQVGGLDLSSAGLISYFNDLISDLSLTSGVFEVAGGQGTGTATINIDGSHLAAKPGLIIPYKVDSITGSIDGVAPSNPAYFAKALQKENRLIDDGILFAGNGGRSVSFSAQIGSFFAFALVSDQNADAIKTFDPASLNSNNNPEAFSSIGAANRDGQVHMIPFGRNVYGFEDLSRASDSDFNDIILSIRT